MKKIRIMLFLFLVGGFFSCLDSDKLTQEQEIQFLNELFAEIETMAKSKTCENATSWSFTAYGSKACGGPIGYIAYPTTIDTALFLEKIEAHKIAQQKYNVKWGVYSDCALAAQPNGVICENGNPVFRY